jgi:hypothetical protein
MTKNYPKPSKSAGSPYRYYRYIDDDHKRVFHKGTECIRRMSYDAQALIREFIDRKVHEERVGVGPL